ncbi:hypothetical protein SHIRM173S_02521 [Streptomyces hirsutus]
MPPGPRRSSSRGGGDSSGHRQRRTLRNLPGRVLDRDWRSAVGRSGPVVRASAGLIRWWSMSLRKDSGGRAGPPCDSAGVASSTSATRRCRGEPSCARFAPSAAKNSVIHMPDRQGKYFGFDELPGSSEPRFSHTGSPRDASVLFLNFTADPLPGTAASAAGPSSSRSVPPSGRTWAPAYVTFAPARSILQTRGLQPARVQPSSRPDGPSSKSALSQHQYRHSPLPAATDREDR